MSERPGRMPEPEAESPEIEPGGADALEQPDYQEDGPWTPDLPPEANPAVEDNIGGEVGDDIGEGEEKQQEGERSEPHDKGASGEPDEPSA